MLTKEPKLLLDANFAGKPESIHLVIGRRPGAAFGNSTGDREMLEYATIENGARLGMLVLHDDAEREYADAAVLVPPRSSAVLSNAAETAPTQRDRHLQFIAKRGRMIGRRCLAIIIEPWWGPTLAAASG